MLWENVHYFGIGQLYIIIALVQSTIPYCSTTIWVLSENRVPLNPWCMIFFPVEITI